MKAKRGFLIKIRSFSIWFRSTNFQLKRRKMITDSQDLVSTWLLSRKKKAYCHFFLNFWAPELIVAWSSERLSIFLKKFRFRQLWDNTKEENILLKSCFQGWARDRFLSNLTTGPKPAQFGSFYSTSRLLKAVQSVIFSVWFPRSWFPPRENQWQTKNYSKRCLEIA